MPQLPDSVPIHGRSRESFHKLRTADISSHFKIVKERILETVLRLLDDPIDDMDHHIESLISNYQDIRSLEQESIALQNSLDSAKQQYKISSDQFDPIDFDKWTGYTTRELPTPPKLSTLFLESSSEKTKSASPLPYDKAKEDRLLTALPYVWKDPESVIPDEQNEEDDLKIEGGKIELICPITLKTFENPMISKKCDHVFDLTGLDNYFDGPSIRDCPQAGCSQKLTHRDFEPDELMKLRCKIAVVNGKHKRTSQKLNVI